MGISSYHQNTKPDKNIMIENKFIQIWKKNTDFHPGNSFFLGLHIERYP